MDRSSPRTRISAAPDMGGEGNDPRLTLDGSPIELTPTQRELFNALYREHFDFVFRNLRRLGVAESAIDDALQDVFLVGLRRIAEFCDGTHPKAWLFAIVLRVAGNHRRSLRRRGDPVALMEERHVADTVGAFQNAPAHTHR